MHKHKPTVQRKIGSECRWLYASVEEVFSKGLYVNFVDNVTQAAVGRHICFLFFSPSPLKGIAVNQYISRETYSVPNLSLNPNQKQCEIQS